MWSRYEVEPIMSIMRNIQRDIVGAFIFSADDKLLLGKNAKGGVYQGAYLVPGGGVEPEDGGSLVEVQEEVNLDISGAQIEQFEEVITGQSEKTLKETGETVLVDMKFYDFRIAINALAADILISVSDEFAETRWVPTAELANLVLSPGVQSRLEREGYLVSTT